MGIDDKFDRKESKGKTYRLETKIKRQSSMTMKGGECCELSVSELSGKELMVDREPLDAE